MLKTALGACLMFVWVSALTPLDARAQEIVSIEVHVTHARAPVAGALVTIGDRQVSTDQNGLAIVLISTAVTATVTKDGFVPASLEIAIAPTSPRRIDVELERLPNVEEVVTVSATRTDQRIEDQPMRVEVLNREEIEEKLLMTPGDIVMMLNEMGGMRVQATSPGLGASTVRVQGMRGRYTRFFSDGLPLFGEVGGLGLLQIPPMDLGQVEVIKGIASSLYGAGALGGVVNLISRQPGRETEREILVNQSTRGATDLVAWYSTPSNTGWSLTLLGGGHWQVANDVNDDVWADLAGYSRGVVRPRLFWNNGRGSTFFATVGVMGERRTGGTHGEVLPSAGVPYEESLDTRRVDGGFVAQTVVGGRFLWSARAAGSEQQHRHQFGEVLERDRHDTTFAETTLRATKAQHVFVAGAALERNTYRGTDVTRFDFRYLVPGVFGQADLELAKWFSVSMSGRLDWHNVYGTFFSPRVSALLRSGAWTSRVSMGTGFYAPSALTEETEAAGLSRASMPVVLQAERGRSGSIDLTHSSGAMAYTATLFGSRIAHPMHVDRAAGLVITNLDQPTTNLGAELIATYRHAPLSVTATYAFVRSRETVGGTLGEVALTPRHSAGLVGMWEKEDVGRLGVECYVTGGQRLEENPYRIESRPYVIVGLLAERQLGRYRLFVNGENLTGIRQTTWDPLIRPTRAADGRWTVDAWSPLEGQNINGGIRVRF